MRALALVALAACGPDLRDLVDQHHYREAVCGAHDGWGGDRDLVGHALDRAASPRIQVYAIHRDELVGLLGPNTEAIASRARFVRVIVETDQLPVDAIDAAVEVSPGAAPDWPLLLRLTSETRPPDREGRSYANAGNVLKGLFTLVTAGTGLLVLYPLGLGFTSDAVTLPPTDDDYALVAPTAYALHQAMASGCHAAGDADTTRTRCTFYFALAPVGHVTLAVTMRYRADRVDHSSCTVERTSHVDLGDAATLDATTERAFGNRLRALSEL